MRKITAVFTALTVLLTVMIQPVFAKITDSGSFELINQIQNQLKEQGEPELDLGNNLAVWSTYMFFTGENGISVVDVKGGTVLARWVFDNGEIPGIQNFTPVESLVTDDYIVVSNEASVAIIKNPKGFNDEIPEVICRVTKDGGSFGSVKKILVVNDSLYIFAKATDGTAEAFIIDLTTLEDVVDANVKVISTEDCSQVISLGSCDYMWNRVENDGEALYAVLYNNTTAPQKILTLKAIDIETNEVSDVELLKGSTEGYYASVYGANEETDGFMDSEIYVTGSDVTPIRLGDLCESGLATVTYTESGAKVKIEESGLVLLAKIFNCSTEDFKAVGVISVQIDFGTSVSYFSYHKDDDVYEQGTIAAGGKYIFVHSNSSTSTNKLITVKKDTEGLRVAGKRDAAVMSGKTGATDMVCIDDKLVALYGNSDNLAVVYDIINPENIPIGTGGNVPLNGSIKTGNYTDIVKWGNTYYYISTGDKGVGVIETDEASRSASISYTDGKFPIKLYGFGVNGENISIEIDNETTVTTVVENGLWSYDIHYIENGTHKFSVNNGVKTPFTVNVDAEPLVKASAKYEKELYGISVMLTNNTDKYADAFKSENFTLKFYEYDKDNNLVFYYEDFDINVNVGYGETTSEGEILYPEMMMEIPNGGYTEVIIVDENDNPVAATIAVKENSTEYGEIPSMYGDLGEISIKISEVDYQNRKIIIEGHIKTDSSRLIAINVTGGQMTPYKIVETDADGNFDYEYVYDGGETTTGATYDITAKTVGGGTAQTVVEYHLMSSTEFGTVLGEIKGLEDGEALIDYLDGKDTLKMTLGIDFDNEDYKALSNSDKFALMDDVLDEIKAGAQTVATTFKNGAKSLRKAAREKAAFDAIKSETATKATLTGILREYNDVFKISSDLWEKYSNHELVQDINEKFLSYNITSISQVKSKLKDAYDFVTGDGDGGSGGSGGGGGGGGGGGSSSKDDDDKVDPNGGIGNKYEIDVNIATGTHENGYNKYFHDLANVDWAVKAINALAERNIVDGVGGMVFAPNNSVKREEFVKMLVQALGLYDSTATTDFNDVSSSHWAYSYIASAQKCGLTKGTYGNNFGIGQNISREEMATMAYRAMIISGQTVSAGDVTFADKNQISNYAYDAVGAMSKAGILNGVGGNMFAPKDICSRAMAAKVVYEIIY